MYYRWSAPEDAVDFVGSTESDDRWLLWHDPLLGEPLPDLEDWTPPQVVCRGARRVNTDAPMSRLVNLVSAKAAEVLSDIWSRHAILYPLVTADASDDSFFMVVVKTQLDCIDRQKSQGPLQKYGSTPDLFANVESWVFDTGIIGDADAFVLPDSSTTVYVSERFKNRVVESGLRGFCLKTRFWEEDPWVS